MAPRKSNPLTAGANKDRDDYRGWEQRQRARVTAGFKAGKIDEFVFDGQIGLLNLLRRFTADKPKRNNAKVGGPGRK